MTNDEAWIKMQELLQIIITKVAKKVKAYNIISELSIEGDVWSQCIDKPNCWVDREGKLCMDSEYFASESIILGVEGLYDYVNEDQVDFLQNYINEEVFTLDINFPKYVSVVDTYIKTKQ